MSKYDDIQRFKEKIHMENIDYKEIPTGDNALALHRWSILEQVAADGNSTVSINTERCLQPAPTTATEFSSSLAELNTLTVTNVPVSSLQEYQPIPLDPLPHTVRQPDELLTTARRSMDKLARSDNVVEQRLPPVRAGLDKVGDPQSDTQRFKKIFSKKKSSVRERETGRDTPLRPLLEMIATCR